MHNKCKKIKTVKVDSVEFSDEFCYVRVNENCCDLIDVANYHRNMGLCCSNVIFQDIQPTWEGLIVELAMLKHLFLLKIIPKDKIEFEDKEEEKNLIPCFRFT